MATDRTAHGERREPRRPVLLNARCRESSWLVHHVELADISSGGCCIIGGPEGLQVGQDVHIRFADVKAIPGKVCWTEDNSAGVQFDEQLDSEVVDELGQDFSATDSNVIDIRRYVRRD